MINWEKELEAIFNDPLLADVEVVAKWKVYNVKIIDFRGSYPQTICARPVTGNCRRPPTPRMVYRSAKSD